MVRGSASAALDTLLTRRVSRTGSIVVMAAMGLALAPVAAAQEGAGGLGAPRPEAGAERTPEQVPPAEGYGVAPDAGDADVPPPPSDVPAPPGAEPPSAYDEAPAPPPARYPSARDGGTTLAEGVRVPSRIATRLRVLDSDFDALASRGGSSLVDGILSILTGGLSITFGFVIDDELLSPYLFVYGGAGVARGIVDLALMPDPSDAAIQFSHMPMGTMPEVRARLEYGERELESIAARTRLARILDASLNIATGVAIVPLYLGPNDFELDVFGTFMLIGAGISVISGVINLLSRSEAERRWDAYSELRKRLEREEQSLSLRFGAMPLPGGGAFTVGAWF